MYKYYKKYVPYLFLLPAGIILTLFFFIPFFETILLSFFDYNTNIYHPSFVSLANYTALLKSPLFYKVLINTFIYLIAAVPFLVVFPLYPQTLFFFFHIFLRFSLLSPEFPVTFCHIFFVKIPDSLRILLNYTFFSSFCVT